MRKRILAAILLATILVSAFALFACNDDEKTVSFVKTDGAKIIDEKGNAIGLYGTNLGGWLVQESWLVPTDIGKEYGQIDMMIELANRFGEDGMQELLDVYEDNWVSEIDFQRIKALGLNCVRIPFTYLNFVNAVKKVGDRYERTPYEELKVDESKFARLDWAIEMCKKYSLYAILDMHGAVGSQSGNDHTGDIAYPGGGRLWGEDETGEICRQKTKSIWVAIANRYKNDTTVAVYDLMNEPGIKDKNGNQTTTTRTHEYFDELYKAIREVDGNHIVCMESCWNFGNLPDPSKYGWENVMYQYHHYNWASAGVANSVYYGSQITFNNLSSKGKYNVPVIIGEFNVWADSHPDKVNATGKQSSQTEEEAWDGVMELYCGLGWNFTTWNFKHAAEHSSWGLFNYDNSVDRMWEQANYKTMSKDEIATIWARHNSENYVVNTSLANCITPRLASFNTNGNDNRSLKEIKAERNYYILTGEKSA